MSGLLAMIAGSLHPVTGAKAPVQIILTSGTSWTVPADWNNANNKIECIGAGGVASTQTNAYGGGGGAYARKNNLVLTPNASVAIQIGTSLGTQYLSNTWLGSAATVMAFGANGTTGGAAASCVGDVAFSGGSAALVFRSGGGGAAGPNGNGLSTSVVNGAGGAGDAGFGGAGSAFGSGLPGEDGTEWGAAGSGGGAGSKGGGTPGELGGKFGGGGGSASGGNGGIGAPGLIVITYTPA